MRSRKLLDELSNNFKSKIRLNYNHDESLIGGLDCASWEHND